MAVLMMKNTMVAVLCSLFVCFQLSAAVWTIRYPQSEVEGDVRYEYPLALLELALQKTSVRYELKSSLKPMHQARALKRLEENLDVNVVWSMTDVQREQQLRPIRIPITRGLIGWRVFLAHKNSPFLTVPVNNMSDLLAFSPVQGISWPDTKILQANGFNVVTARDYIEATEIIGNRIADFFPRSVIEVFQELETQYATNMKLREGVAIYYPTALYFFTNKQNLTLSKLIETGLEKALEDGSYQKLFQEHYGETIARLNLQNSTYFRLANPLLPPLTPLTQEEYWYSPIQTKPAASDKP